MQREHKELEKEARSELKEKMESLLEQEKIVQEMKKKMMHWSKHE